MPRQSSVLSLLFLIVFACTIIEDSDITSISELNSLKWNGVQFVQETNSGNSSAMMQLVYDSVKNVVDPVTGVLIVKKMKFSLPSLANRKMRLRSGTDANTNLYISYKSGNQPFNVWITKGDSIVELYRFRYNTSNVLSKIISIINPADDLPPKAWTNDTLIYNTNNRIGSMTRRSPIGTPTGTISVEYYNPPNTGIIKVTFSGRSYQSAGFSCNDGGSTNTCGGYQIQPWSSQPPQLGFRFNNLSTLSTTESFTDQRFYSDNSSGCQGCSRELDKYYLHPTMIVRSQLPLGNDLTMIYMIDWWVPGTIDPVTNQNLNKNDVVNLNFTYVQ